MGRAKFQLPNEKVIVKYIKRKKGMISNPKHVAYGGKLEGAIDAFPLRMARNGALVNPLTAEEKAFLESDEGLSCSLSVNNGGSDFWKGFEVVVGKDNTPLDLSDPTDYIKYKVLKTYTDSVCESLNDVNKKQSYKYVLTKIGDETAAASRTVDITRDAYVQFGKLSTSRQKMIDFLRAANKRVSDDSTTEYLNATIGKMVEKNPAEFLQVITDDFYKERVFVGNAISKGAIIVQNGRYATSEGVGLAERGRVNDLGNALSFLKDPKNQDVLHAIEARINSK